MDRIKADRLFKKTKELLASLKEEGLVINFSSIKFSTQKVTMRVEMIENTTVQGIQAKSKEELDFIKFHEAFGFELNDLNKKFYILNGHKKMAVQICGILPNGRVNIIAVKDEKGKKYRVPLELVKGAMKNALISQ